MDDQCEGEAIDAVGNQSDWSAVRTVKTDITLPTVVFTAEPSGTINNPRPTWEWEGTDARSGIGHYLVQLDDEPSFTTRDTMWTPASNLADGEHILRVQAVDVVGNVSEWLVSDAVVIDTIPPAVPGIPEPEETPTKLTTPAWTWKASAGAASYNVYLDDEPIANVTEPEFTTADYATFGVAALAEGRHNMQVTALDEWGNESDMSGTGHVLVDLTPPEVPELDPLPPFTKADMIRFVWTAVDGAVSYDLEGIANGVKIPVYTLDIAAKVTGDVVATRVRAYDSVGNVSEWSAAVSTIVDRTGPTTTAVTTPPATTNTTRPTWGWSGDDAGLSGVAYYIVTLDGQPPFNTTGTSFTPAHDLPAGAHTLTVQAVDALGNIGNLLEFATTIVVEPVIIDVIPLPGTYTIDRVSTLVLNITGMIDAPLEVAVGANALETWRIVELYRTPASTKFYVLLDEEVLMPGRLVLTVDAGMTQRTFIYEVLNERSGFGFFACVRGEEGEQMTKRICLAALAIAMAAALAGCGGPGNPGVGRHSREGPIWCVRPARGLAVSKEYDTDAMAGDGILAAGFVLAITENGARYTKTHETLLLGTRSRCGQPGRLPSGFSIRATA